MIYSKQNYDGFLFIIFPSLSVGIVRNQVIGKISEEICLPLYSILLSIGNPTVDYFSLDVEGAEMGILKAVPWDKVDIKVGMFHSLEKVVLNCVLNSLSQEI